MIARLPSRMALAAVLALSVCAVRPASADRSSRAGFAPGRFIVKFTPELTQCAHCLLATRQSFASALPGGSTSLDALVRTFHVGSARGLLVHRCALSTGEAQHRQRLRVQDIARRFPRRGGRGGQHASVPDVTNVYVLSLPPTARQPDVEAACEAFRQDPHVEYAHPDYEVGTDWAPNDPSYPNQWALAKLGMATAWDMSRGAETVVAVVDSGVDGAHPDMAGRLWTNAGEIAGNGVDDDANGFVDDVQGWDFASNDATPADGYWHGTHVAGVIGAATNNNVGVAGVAPSAAIMPLRGLDNAGRGYMSDLANAILYAAANGADVINNSWGCIDRCPSVPLAEDAVRSAIGLGAVVVFSAGNGNDDVQYFSPQNMTDPKPIVVAAVDSTDTRASFSNTGASLDVTGPGVSVLSIYLNNQYAYGSGTSFSAPHAAGMAALLLAASPALTVEQVRQILRDSADDLGPAGFDPQHGAGRLNAQRALGLVSVPKPDLIMSSVSTSTGPIAPGSVFSLINTARNQGNAAAGAFVVGFQLSPDAVYGGSGDLWVSQRSLSGLGAGSNHTATTSLTVPAATPPGAYYVCALADANNTVQESVGENNGRCTPSPITVATGDLVVSAFTAPSALTTGVPFSVSATVDNLGGGLISSSTLGFYLSSDAVIATTDPLIASTTLSNIAGGASSSKTLTVTVPATRAAGSYHLGAIADSKGARIESNETNNARLGPAVTLSSGVDLVMSQLSGPSSGATGAPIDIANTVANQGVGAAGESYVGLYLSGDQTITTGDTRIGSRKVSSVAAGGSSAATTRVTLPSTISLGTYYLGAIADYSNTQQETDGNNNSLTGQPITLSPGADLVMTAVSGPASAARGAKIGIATTAKNQGIGSCGSFSVGIYLSTDAAIASSDIRIGSRSVSSLNAGALSTWTSTITLSTSLAPGTYYLGAIADYTGARPETSEANNALAGPTLTIQ